MRAISLVLTVFLFVGAAYWGFGQEQPEMEDNELQAYGLAKPMFEKGKQLLVRGNLPGAEKTLKQCLELFPHYSEAHYYLSQVYYKTGDRGSALTHIKKARANAAFMKDVLAAAQLEYFNGLKKEKQELQNKLVDVREDAVFQQIKHHIKVIDDWLKEPLPSLAQLTVDYHYWHATISLKMKRYTEAREQWKQYLEVVKANPQYRQPKKYGSALLNLAVSCFMLRQYESAMDYLTRAEPVVGRSYPELKRAIRETKDISGDLFVFLRHLLETSDETQTSLDELQTFVSLYTKLHHRPQLLTEEVLYTLYRNYRDYNVLVDFIEKIPIREPGTVIKLFEKVNNIEETDKKDRVFFTTLFQCLLELLSHTAKYAPDRYDYDALIGKLIDIPLDSRRLYDKLFEFFKQEPGIPQDKKDLIDFVLSGVNNRALTINNIEYRFVINDTYRQAIEEILESQQVCSMAALLKINRLMDMLSRDEAGPAAPGIGNRVIQLMSALPLAVISGEAPRPIRERVMSYSRSAMDRDLVLLMRHINEGSAKGAKKNLRLIVRKIKRDYLLPQLKDHLVGLVYALNAKNPRLRVFLNPNLTRLHDFSYRKNRTPWNYSGLPPGTDTFSEYSLCGGLSRLNIAFAAKWQEQLFSRTYVYNAPQLQSVLINLLDLYPLPRDNQSIHYDALMVDFGMALIRDAREDDAVRLDVISELGTVTTGYHYRKAVDYLTGRSKRHNLFFSEIRQLGDHFFRKGKYLEKCPGKGLSPGRYSRSGNIYYHTFGNLAPQPLKVFPQDVSRAFAAGWVSGEMIDEFKIKLGWLLYKKNIPAALLGQVLYSYLNKTVPRILSQNHARDYFSTYFVFEIFNNSYLNKILKDFQKQGYLKLK